MWVWAGFGLRRVADVLCRAVRVGTGIGVAEGDQQGGEDPGLAADEAEVVLSGVEDSYRALVEELGACPMCGSTESWGNS